MREREEKMERVRHLLNEFMSGPKERRVAAALVVAVFAVGGITAGLAFSLHEDTYAQEYNKQVTLGQQCLKEGDYNGAQLAFNEAIKIDPKKPEAYDKSIEAYEKAGDKKGAKKVKKERDENVDEDVVEVAEDIEEPEEEATEATEAEEPVEAADIVQAFKAYIKSNPDKLLAKTGEEYPAADGNAGLICATGTDVDADGADELVLISSTQEDSVSVSINVYEQVEEDFVVSDSVELDFADQENAGGEYDFFLKENDEQTYLFVNTNYTIDKDSVASGGRLYEIKGDEITNTMTSLAAATAEGYTFTVNDENRSEQAVDGDMKKVQENTPADYEWWAGESNEYLDEADLQCEGNYTEGENPAFAFKCCMPTFDEDDETQTHLCNIKRGKTDADGNQVFDETNKVLLITDYTGLND